MTTDLWAYERPLWAQGIHRICGVDEAGRGPLAGPVYAAAVLLPPELDLERALPGLDDSKRLTDQTRRTLFEQIQRCALAFSVAFATPEEIDEVNILQATFLAMGRAVASLSVPPEQVLVDGNREPPLELPTKTIVKGDSLSASIAAASILAKVSRDDCMIRLAAQYPEYGFEVHKGYGTRRHYAALEIYGPCPIHRQTFLRKFYARQ